MIIAHCFYTGLCKREERRGSRVQWCEKCIICEDSDVYIVKILDRRKYKCNKEDVILSHVILFKEKFCIFNQTGEIVP